MAPAAIARFIKFLFIMSSSLHFALSSVKTCQNHHLCLSITRNKGLIALYHRYPYTMYIIIVILQLYLLFYNFYALICINNAALRCKLFILSDIQLSQLVMLAEQLLKTFALAYIQGL